MRTIFLHGFATTPDVWHNQLVDAAPTINFHNMQAQAETIGQGLGDETILVGWSMGGMVALKIAALYPEKIQKLILVSTTPKFIKTEDFPFGLPLALLRRLEKRIAVEGTAAFHSLVFKNGQTIGLAHLNLAEVEDDLKELEKIDLRGILAQIKMPTLIIQGDKDDICLPGAAAYLQEKIENSKLVILPGVGHAPMVEAPEKFNRIVAGFVNDHVK